MQPVSVVRGLLGWVYGFRFAWLRSSRPVSGGRFHPLLKGTLMTYSTTLSVFSDDVFTDAGLRTLAGFLGGYSGLTRDAFALDLRQFASGATTAASGCSTSPEATSKRSPATSRNSGGRATISRRVCTITCLYRYAAEEGLLDRSPAVHGVGLPQPPGGR